MANGYGIYANIKVSNIFGNGSNVKLVGIISNGRKCTVEGIVLNIKRKSTIPVEINNLEHFYSSPIANYDGIGNSLFFRTKEEADAKIVFLTELSQKSYI